MLNYVEHRHPLLRITRQHPPHQLHQVVVRAGREGKRVVLDLIQQVSFTPPAIRVAVEHQPVKHDPQGPDVHLLGVVLFLHQHLWRHVR